MIRFLACIALFVMLVPVSALNHQERARTLSTKQVIQFERIALNENAPQDRKLGRLTFLDGWKLTSDNTEFGGISALHAQGGDSFLALSDSGMLFGFTVPDADRMAARRSFIVPLPGIAAPQSDKKLRDTESWAFDPGTGRIWIGFEHSNAITRYAPSFARQQAVVRPPEMAEWPSNGGAEAMLKMPGGRFIVFSEEAYGPDNSSEALIFSGDPASVNAKAVRFGYRPPQGYRVTDAALLPDGKVILLNRRFTLLEGVSAAISIADPAAIVASGAWEGQEIARLKPPYTVDNMEGIAVTQESGETIIWLISDDNFQSFQRTLLLKFRLEGK